MSQDAFTVNDGSTRGLRRTFERFGLLGVWLIVFAGFSLLNPNQYLTWGNIGTMLGSQSVLVILALGLTVSLAAGEFDLSVANVLWLLR